MCQKDLFVELETQKNFENILKIFKCKKKMKRKEIKTLKSKINCVEYFAEESINKNSKEMLTMKK